MDPRTARRKPGEKSLWEQMGRKTEEDTEEVVEESKPTSFPNIRNMFSGKNAADTATEEVGKLFKKNKR